MRAVAWSLAVTGLAATLLAVCGRDLPGAHLRWLGGSGGAVLALAGVLLGFLHPDTRQGIDLPTDGALLRRFFQERRRASRHRVEIPVRVSVNGCACEATLLNVSSAGALLRLQARPGQRVPAEIGQPVTIEDYPAGTIARVGAHGIYVDFAIAFEPAGR